MIFNSVNRYFMDSVVQLSQQRAVNASEDIFDDKGVKLWAKGNPVSSDLQEKLLRRRLAKPLEMALEVENALSSADIIVSAERQLSENPFLHRIAGPDALAVLKNLRSFPIPGPIRLLLTSAQVNNPRTYQHTLYTMLVSAGIASRLKASEADTQHLLIAALLHDIGEMYINPEYLRSAYRLEPTEWKHVASHPRIGELLIKEMTALPPSVAQIVAQHHERLDGSGYPSQLPVIRQNHLSGWLAIADTASAILGRGDIGAPQRVSLALKIVPEEYDRAAVAAMISALREAASQYGEPGDCICIKRATSAWEHVQYASEEVARLLSESPSALIRDACETTRLVLDNLGKSLRATGVGDFSQLGDAINDSEVLSEICLIVRETTWRMRNTARNIYLRAEKHPDAASQLEKMAALIDALNDSESVIPACKV